MWRNTPGALPYCERVMMEAQQLKFSNLMPGDNPRVLVIPAFDESDRVACLPRSTHMSSIYCCMAASYVHRSRALCCTQLGG